MQMVQPVRVAARWASGRYTSVSAMVAPTRAVRFATAPKSASDRPGRIRSGRSGTIVGFGIGFDPMRVTRTGPMGLGSSE